MSGATLSAAVQDLTYPARTSTIRWFGSIPHSGCKDKAAMNKQRRKPLIEPRQRIARPFGPADDCGPGPCAHQTMWSGFQFIGFGGLFVSVDYSLDHRAACMG